MKNWLGKTQVNKMQIIAFITKSYTKIIGLYIPMKEVLFMQLLNEFN